MTELQRSYSLVELIYFADSTQSSDDRNNRWRFLKEDLLNGIAWLKAGTQERIAQKNVSRIVDHLYQRPMSEVTPRYSFDKKFKRVVDLYYLTEKEIEGLAYSFQIPCGQKTLLRINNILTTHQLPPLHDVAR